MAARDDQSAERSRPGTVVRGKQVPASHGAPGSEGLKSAAVGQPLDAGEARQALSIMRRRA
jgi:hypothetical protein